MPTLSDSSWADEVLARLSGYEDNWDNRGAKAPEPSAVQSVRSFLWIWGTHPRRPSARGTPEGGVILEWYSDSASVILDFGPSGEVCAEALTPLFESDGPLRLIGDDVGAALMELWADMSARHVRQSRPSEPLRCLNCGGALDLDDIQRGRKHCPKPDCQAAEASDLSLQAVHA